MSVIDSFHSRCRGHDEITGSKIDAKRVRVGFLAFECRVRVVVLCTILEEAFVVLVLSF